MSPWCNVVWAATETMLWLHRCCGGNAVAGRRRLHIEIKGLRYSACGAQGHAGAVTMATRRDAVAAAAEAMFWLERRCGGASLTDVLEEALEDPSLVCTVGEVDIHPGTSNVIAKFANISVDIRRAAVLLHYLRQPCGLKSGEQALSNQGRWDLRGVGSMLFQSALNSQRVFEERRH